MALVPEQPSTPETAPWVGSPGPGPCQACLAHETSLGLRAGPLGPVDSTGHEAKKAQAQGRALGLLEVLGAAPTPRAGPRYSPTSCPDGTRPKVSPPLDRGLPATEVTALPLPLPLTKTQPCCFRTPSLLSGEHLCGPHSCSVTAAPTAARSWQGIRPPHVPTGGLQHLGRTVQAGPSPGWPLPPRGQEWGPQGACGTMVG